MSTHSIDGLIKWMQRDEWREEFEATFERHFGPACRTADIGLDELAEVLDDDRTSSTLWGCAFEDLVASRRAGRSIADEYLKRRGWKESAGTRAFIQALRDSTMSLYEVSGIVVGESFLARDLVRGGEPVHVFERSATRSLSQWDRIASRVVTVLGKTQITGAVLPFSHPLAENALALIARTRKGTPAEDIRIARSRGGTVQHDGVSAAPLVDDVLAASAFMFSNLWLADVLSRALNPTSPRLQNTDGEPLEFITVHYPLVARARAAAVRAALDGLPSLLKENDAFWNWIDGKPARSKRKKRAATDVQTFGTTMENGAPVLGNVEVTAKGVTLSVNSEARAVRGRALLEPVLAGLVREPLTERETIAQMRSSPAARAGRRDAGRLPPEDERRIVHKGLTDHYRTTLDEPIPALGNRSPRNAVKTPKGREKVIAWLKMLENHTAHQGPDDPMGSYDLTWMWQELGIADARQ